MSSEGGSLRKRREGPDSRKAKEASAHAVSEKDDVLDKLILASKAMANPVEWDYRIALGLITVAAFLTRFWGISHPNEVVFDEVHFGKVSDGEESWKLVS